MIKATMNGFLVICIGIVVVFGMRMPQVKAQKEVLSAEYRVLRTSTVASPSLRTQNSVLRTTDYKALYFADNKLFNEALQRERELKTALQSEHDRAAREHEQRLAAERQRDAYLQKINQAKLVLQ